MDALFTHNLTRIKLSSICCITVTVIHLQLILLGLRDIKCGLGCLSVLLKVPTVPAYLTLPMFLFHHWIFDLLARCRDPSVNQSDGNRRPGGRLLL